jgi:hypothetical protein
MRPLRRLLPFVVVGLVWWLLMRTARAAPSPTIDIQFHAAADEAPGTLCVVAMRMEAKAPEVVTQAFAASIKKDDKLSCELSEKDGVASRAMLSFWNRVGGGCATGNCRPGCTAPDCTPKITLPATVCDPNAAYDVVCTAPTSARTVFVWFDGADGLVLGTPTFESMVAKIPITRSLGQKPITILVRGDYQDDHAQLVPVSTGYSADVPLTPRCTKRTVRLSPSAGPGTKVDVGAVGGGDHCPLAPNGTLDALVSANGTMTATSGRSKLSASWASPPDPINLGYGTVYFAWKRHPLYSGSDCPDVEPVNASRVTCSHDCPSVDPAFCRYKCEAVTPNMDVVPLPLDLVLSSVHPPAPEPVNPQRWTAQLTGPNAELDAFVPPDQRRLEVHMGSWTALETPNRAYRITLGLPNGTEATLVPKDQPVQVIDAHGIEDGQSVRVDPHGERLFHEQVVKVEGPIVDLDARKAEAAATDLAPLPSASLLAGPLFEFNLADSTLPSSYAGYASLDVSWRPTSSRWSVGMLVDYWLMGDRPYISIRAPNDKPAADTTAYNRVYAEFAVAYYPSAITTFGAAIGPGISWAVQDDNSSWVGGTQPSGEMTLYGRVRLVTPFWAEGGIKFIFPEAYEHFSAGDYQGEVTPSSFSGLGLGLYLGLRVGNHTL